LTTEGFVAWELIPPLDAGLRAALAAGKSLVYVCPPAAWVAGPLLAAFPPAEGTPATLILVPGTSASVELAAAHASLADLEPLHPATGAARTQRLLAAGYVRTLIATLPDALELVRRSALQLEGLARVVVGWPEQLLAAGLGAGLDTLLAEAVAVQRIVLTDDEAPLADFLERHARRAPVGWAARVPAAPLGAARYAVVDRPRRVTAARAVLDVLDPHRAIVWDPGPNAPERWAELPAVEPFHLASETAAGAGPADLCIAADLPSADVFTALRHAAREVVVLLDAPQVPYLQRLAAPLDAVRLPGVADRARDRLTQLRRDVRERLAAGLPLPELLALDSLFDEHDPALVAAALLARGNAGPPTGTPADVTTWVRVHVNAGKRDQLRPGEVVGTLLNTVGLAKEDIGRIEIREGFTLVDVRAEEAERAVRGLSGATLRGRRVAARLDRR
jgi:hypothetical protein